VSVPASRRYERFQLARVADWAQSGDTYVYRLTPSSLERARKQGISVERVVGFLGEITSAPVPRRLTEALRRWEDSGTEAHLESVVVLRLANSELLDDIMSTPRLNRAIEERAGPTTAIVRRRDWPQIVSGLQEIGLLPALTDLPE
jgi:hypothetical protein